MRVWRVVAAAALAVVMVWWALSYRERVRRDNSAAAAAAQRELQSIRLAPPGTAPQAGISARTPIDVRPIPDKLMIQLRNSHDFQRLHHRCGVCHEIADPALHTRDEWIAVVERMRALIEAAGLLPLSEDDRDAVLRVLSAHARL